MKQLAPFFQFGHCLRQMRAAREVSGTELARRLGCDTALIYRWESGISLPPPWWWPRIVTALGLRPSELTLLLVTAFGGDPPHDPWLDAAVTLFRHWRRGHGDPGATVAAWLRDLRTSWGLSQARIAEKLGIPLATYRCWEHGRRRPALSTLALVFRGHAGPAQWCDLLMAMVSDERA